MVINTKEIEVRYAETDQMGIVYHANYLIWMEIGRTALIKELGFVYASLEERGFVSPVLDLQIQYKTAMRYGDKAQIKTWIESHDRLRTTYGYEICHEDGTIAATATSIHALVKKDSFRPVSLAKIDEQWHATYNRVKRVQE